MQNLYNIIDRNFTNVECEMRNIPHSFSLSNLEVIDFIKVKDQFCKKTNISQKPASCNCLYIKISNDKLVFIVIKDFFHSLVDNDRINSISDFINLLYRKLDKSEYINRIEDSVDLLSTIAKYYKLNKPSYDKICDENNLSIYYCIIVNITHNDYLTARLSNLNLFEKQYKVKCVANVSIIIDSFFDHYINEI